MALEITWDGKTAYARIEAVLIRRDQMPAGLKGGGGGPAGTPAPEYGMSVVYAVFEDGSAQKLLSQGSYVGNFDSSAQIPALTFCYQELKKLDLFKGAKVV